MISALGQRIRQSESMSDRGGFCRDDTESFTEITDHTVITGDLSSEFVLETSGSRTRGCVPCDLRELGGPQTWLLPCLTWAQDGSSGVLRAWPGQPYGKKGAAPFRGKVGMPTDRTNEQGIGGLPPGYEPREVPDETWMGTLTRATSGKDHRDCLVLTVSRTLIEDDQFGERFETLSRSLPSLVESGIVRTIELVEQAGCYHVVTEYPRGEGFQSSRNDQPLAMRLGVVCRALEVLEYVHGQGMTHLDLTPEALLVDEDGALRIAGVGMAYLLGSKGRSVRLQVPDAAQVVWPYLAPETHQDLIKADFRSDIYSIGVILYELLTGLRPVGHFDLPSALKPELDPRLDSIVTTALSSDPSRRYQRAAELGSAIQHLIPGSAEPRSGATGFGIGRIRTSGGDSTAPVLPGLDPTEMASLTLDSDPPGARVTDLGGAIFGDTPLVLKLPAGAYTFSFRLPEPYLPVTEDVHLIPGAAARIVARPRKRGGEVFVVTAPPGAEVVRAGKPVGITPCTFSASETEAGEILVRKQGYHDLVAPFTVISAQRCEVNLVLKPRLAILEVTTDPVGVDVLDERGVRMSTAPARIHLDAGKRRLTFRSKKGHQDEVLDIEIEPGEEKKLEVALKSMAGIVEVTSIPTGAEVFRDGELVGKTSLVLTLPGQEPVSLILRHPGYQDLEIALEAQGGGRTVAEGRLELLEIEGLSFRGINGYGFRECVNEKDGSALIFIPAGPFTRGNKKGDADERPERTIHLSDYYISRLPVTNEQYREFTSTTGHRTPALFEGFQDGNRPVVGIDWNDAVAYCEWAGVRLPTEAEWEKAARGLDDRIYPWGDQPPLDFFEELGERFGKRKTEKLAAFGLWADATAPVGRYPGGASPFGCLDMSGNVWEWCTDWHDGEYFASSPDQDPQGPEAGNEKVCRGGCWSIRVISAGQLLDRLREAKGFKREAWRFHVPRMTATTRGWFLPNFRFNNLGFRVARSHP